MKATHPRSKPATARPPRATTSAQSAKTADTRRSILEAAEKLFAQRGFALARLEDVGEAVGVTRPALFYHFPDKQALYDAMLEEAFRPLGISIEAALTSTRPIGQRIEDAALAWVDGVAARPTLSRLILRYVADMDEHPMQKLYGESDRLAGIAWKLVQEGIANGELKPLHADPVHSASAIIGTTVFYVTALSALIPSGAHDPLDSARIQAHREETVSAIRRLLGIRGRRKAQRGSRG